MRITKLPFYFIFSFSIACACSQYLRADDRQPTEAARVKESQVLVGYEVTASPGSQVTVTLWYTLDEGATWRLYGRDPDSRSPFEFVARQEGLYGFYITAQNQAGASDSEPATGVVPQIWAFVDFTPPVAQLHMPHVDHSGFKSPGMSPPGAAAGSAQARAMAIRWSAIDDHLEDRPVELGYRRDQTGPYEVIANHLSNTGQFEWPIPSNLHGEIELRLVVTDRGGNVTQSTRLVSLPTPPDAVAPNAMLDPVGQSNQASVSEAQQRRRAELMKQSKWHADRGERKLAIARMRDALRADPTHAVGLVALADLLYADGQYEDALQAYQLGLNQQPAIRTGLEGLARVMIKQRRFQEADQALQRIVEMSPNDAEAWLHLSDVAVYRGDEVAAREHLAKARSVDPSASDIIHRAELRLARLNDLLERYYAKQE